VTELISTPTRPELEILQSAQSAFDKGLFTLSRETFSELAEGYPGSPYATYAQLKIADSYYLLKQYKEALSQYEFFLTEHIDHEATDYVHFQIGNCYFEQYKDEKRDQEPLILAIEKYKQSIEINPNSAYVVQARRRIDQAREYLAQNEAFIARFYLKQKQLNASLNRYRALIDKFPDSEATAEAIAELSSFSEDGEYILANLNDNQKHLQVVKINTPNAPSIVSAYNTDNIALSASSTGDFSSTKRDSFDFNVKCNQSESASFATVSVPANFSLIARTDKENISIFTFSLLDLERPDEDEFVIDNQTCTTPTFSAALKLKNNRIDDNQFQVEISSVSENQLELLELNRPKRALFVLH
jgi:outer membrane protein assembly factor BamD